MGALVRLPKRSNLALMVAVCSVHKRVIIILLVRLDAVIDVLIDRQIDRGGGQKSPCYAEPRPPQMVQIWIGLGSFGLRV